jgi:hypothetical protein
MVAAAAEQRRGDERLTIGGGSGVVMFGSFETAMDMLV